jgi:SAM-dependent methyltransferase
MKDSPHSSQLRAHYAIERELADRLRSAATGDERRRLYSLVYKERTERIEHHPLVERAQDTVATAVAAAPRARLIRTFVDETSVFCEVGAGDGAVARAVAPTVRRAIALDVTDALAIPNDPSVGYEFRVFDGFDLGMTDEADFVYSNDVAEHLHPDDFGDHARAVLKALRPGGSYLCVTPNRLSGPHDISGYFTNEPTGFHLREYTACELANCLRAAGFRRTRLVLSIGGRRLRPLLPVRPVAALEQLLGALPRRARRRPARALAAVKVLATK